MSLGCVGACVALTILLVPAEPRPTHLQYRAIDDPQARAILNEALAHGRRWMGAPAIPIRKVHLLVSEPRETGAALKRGFQLTQVVDENAGEFAIYLSAKPGEGAFAGQLAHEAFHLFFPRIEDLYLEGVAGLFAEKLLKELKLSWEPWSKHFAEGRDPLYGKAYALARSLRDAAGEEALLRLPRTTRVVARTTKGITPEAKRDGVDIDAWLASLPAPARTLCRAAILANFAALDAERKASQPQLSFAKPR